MSDQVAGERERLRQLARTYGLKTLAQELGWTDDYVASAIAGNLPGCSAFWERSRTWLGALQAIR